MKKLLILILSFFCFTAATANRPDSLLAVLDRTIAERETYTARKQDRIDELKTQKARLRSLEEKYYINGEIILNYESFICDSAKVYIQENLRIAEVLGDGNLIAESRLDLAFVNSLSGLFVQASDIMRTIDYGDLTPRQKARYCWTSIRYYENLMKYTDDPQLSVEYEQQLGDVRATLLDLLEPDSDEWLKEEAFRLQAEKSYDEALAILTGIFHKQQANTHEYAMAAMSLAKVYGMKGDRDRENHFLKLAAISDIRFAVKENEALLVLALNLFEEGDIERSYTYISAALSDANFYNSRFKNTVIARVQPVIESNYLNRIDQQRRNLRIYATLISIFLIALIITVSIVSRQIKVVTKARKHLRKMNRELMALNQKLGEANIVKEKYIGHFMSQCAQYINKLDTYRKDVNHKIKTGQIDRLYKPSTKELEKEVEELYKNFDEAFLNLYPDFVSELNSLLEPESRYELEGNRLNSELRIFALIRLGITNLNQIADFLRCSIQTIYNYRSKVKTKARKDIANFEEAVRKFGHTLVPPDPGPELEEE